MKAEIIDLALKGAQATVEGAAKLVGTEAWQAIKQKIVQLWPVTGDGADGDAGDIREAVERLDPGKDPVKADDAVRRWTARYSALLANHPESADELRTLIGDISKQSNQTSTRGNVSALFTGRAIFNNQVVMGDGGSYVKTSTVGATAVLLLIAVLVIYLVVRPDSANAPGPASTGRTAVTPTATKALSDSCGGNLPAAAEPAADADDGSVRQSYTYKVGSASGDGRNMKPGGSIRQAFVAARPYLSQVSAIVGVANTRPHRLDFQILRPDGTVLMHATEDETPANNNKDVVHNIVPAVHVAPRDVLLLVVTNVSKEQVRFFVDPPISNQVPSPFAACIIGQVETPERHVDLRNNILSGSVTGQDVP